MNRRVVFTCAAVISMTWLVSCGKQTPTGPGGAASPSVHIIAPPALTFPGQTGQLTAEETFPDGAKSDVTSAAVWRSSNPSVAFVSSTGLVTLVAAGVTTITATIPSGQIGTLSLAVAPANIAGRVTEAGGIDLPGVQVTIIGGPRDGQVTTTNEYGDYGFGAVTGVQQVKATKDGYTTAYTSIPTDPTHADVVMYATTPYADLSGSWHVTFSASPSCRLPDDVTTRTYAAAVQQNYARLLIRLSDAQFEAGRNWIVGRVSGDNAALWLNTDPDGLCEYEGACFAEQIAGGRTFTLNGSATGSLNGGVLSTVFAGAVTVSGASGTPGSTCTAADHRLTFTR